jgi:dihydrofolate synthase/folylpolyglutamate synthase
LADAGLSAWLRWLETLHPEEIELGLERVGTVAERLGVRRPAPRVVTIGGTNAKGSIAALIEHVLLAHGVSCASYTSPHIEHFRERIRLDGREPEDARIVAALERIEGARVGVPLTFFEFTTLTALELVREQGVEVAVLEVGMGGRLDATNVVDADVAIIGPIGLDHSEWLGPDRDAIGGEKAGIARAGRPLLIGERDPPTGLVEAARSVGANTATLGRDFDWQPAPAGSAWHVRLGDEAEVFTLPEPADPAPFQKDNATTALAALTRLGVAMDTQSMRNGLARARTPGRFEVHPGSVQIILDVAHNPAAAGALAAALRARPVDGRLRLVIAMYRDKDIEGVVAALADVIDVAYPSSMDHPRGASGEHLLTVLAEAGLACSGVSAGPVDALERAGSESRDGDCIVVIGSFATVAAARPAVTNARTLGSL